jgi:hypothetical protein
MHAGTWQLTSIRALPLLQALRVLCQGGCMICVVTLGLLCRGNVLWGAVPDSVQCMHVCLHASHCGPRASVVSSPASLLVSCLCLNACCVGCYGWTLCRGPLQSVSLLLLVQDTQRPTCSAVLRSLQSTVVLHAGCRVPGVSLVPVSKLTVLLLASHLHACCMFAPRLQRSACGQVLPCWWPSVTLL